MPVVINYEKLNKILLTHHSTTIEESSLTYQETELLLEHGLTSKGKKLWEVNRAFY